ncbi:MAG: signal peptidase [Clostridiales bacterium]|jgi:signal peptidase|nr:signal peptidase [Clostridiales bacterium]
MKKIIIGALFGLLLFTKGAPVLTYVYSESMEPIIGVNDGFIVMPTNKYKVGDIIMYRPTVLKAPFITHRIIDIGNNGYITKGDNSPYIDQQSGEPTVIQDRIVGKVLTLNGQPLILPGLGSFVDVMQATFGKYNIVLSVIFLVLGILSFGNRSAHRRKPRRRLRLQHIYRFIVIVAVVSVIGSVYLGSRVIQIQYLVSEYPGTLGDQIELNQPGQLTMKVENKGFIPVWSISSGISPISVMESPDFLWMQSEATAILNVKPQLDIGKYQGYVQVHNYPILLPRQWVVFLHNIDPSLAIITTGFMTGLLFELMFIGIKKIPGFEGWIPLKVMEDKIRRRRIKRLRAKLFGRRREGNE